MATTRPALIRTAPTSAAALVRRRWRARELIGWTLVVLGAALLAWWGLHQPATVAEVPYSYRPVAATPVGPLQDLTKLAPDARLELEELVATASGRPVATLARLHRPGRAPATVEWRSALAEPVLRNDIDPTEELRLLQALRDHLPPDTTVLALPALSARLETILDLDAPLAAADDRAGLRILDPWQPAADAIRAFETQRDGRTGDATADMAWRELQDGLLADIVEGVARLRRVARRHPAYLVLHVQDVFVLGLARPDRLAVGLHDFPGGGQVHDQARLVKSWMADNGHAGYAGLPRGTSAFRVFFLPEPEGTATLIANLLPFNTARLGGVTGLTLVFQHRGYWVYRLDP